MSNLLMVWTSHLKDAEKRKKFELAVRNEVHSPVWNRLKDILKDKKNATDALPKKLEAYDNPAWAYKQAHLNGYLAGIQFALDLIDLEKE